MLNNEVNNLILYLFYFSHFLLFINNHGKQRKMLKKLNIHCYLYQAKKHFYRMNGVRDLTVIVSKRCDCKPSSALVS